VLCIIPRQLLFAAVLLATLWLFLTCSRPRRSHKERYGIAYCQIIDYDWSIYIDLFTIRIEIVHSLEGDTLAGLARGECLQFRL
jgi:hypothetical protein